MTSALLFGSTGLVGGQILSTLLTSDAFKTIQTISRRAPKAASDKLEAIVEADSDAWAAKLSALTPVPSVVISAVGTTKAQAGSIEAQWKIDHDLNVALAEAAKAAGVPTFVFVSSAGTRGGVGGSRPYGKMKVGVEDKIKALEFEQAIVLRPGVILGAREGGQHGTSNVLMNSMLRGVGKISPGLQDMFGQESTVIARAAVAAASLAAQGKAPAKYWVLEQKDVVRLGREEWKA